MYSVAPLGEIRGSDADRDFASKYIELYGDNGLVGEDRKKVFRAIVPQKKQVITGAAAYVVKTLFGMAKHEVYETSTLDECVRMATLLVTDVPQMYDVQRVLQVASDMQKRRKEFASPLHGVCNRYADNSYKLAESLLLAQSIGSSIDDSKRVNSSMIIDAIGLLSTERNGHSSDASNLLQKLKIALDTSKMRYLLK
ncbi:hypothetical protein BCR32DRAFT_276211 [Anaeromyces robustus]|uniref:Uncharacterized protein n=1 Tax=Anaeromyces robustus TaxID=1754192 RepID=A0A1Y1XIF1_9FUNG|nr:hypothetical protein BCR32DRAFT_276211 [Anaeromyces robustus]|eukprot:ORX85541.1 hypothetical protein BCR32DRAFT_276211 [Anaeromyces robustus]